MDRDFCEIDDEYSDKTHQLNYFYQQDSVQHKSKQEKPTLELSDFDINNSQNSFGIAKNFTVSLKESPEIRKRTKKQIIKVNSKTRSLYLKARKGSKEQTHDLSTNVCTIVKSLFQEFLTFESPSHNDTELIRQFMNEKNNLLTLKKLFMSSNKSSGSQFLKDNQKVDEGKNKKVSFGDFFSSKMEDTQILKEVLRSRKMKFTNKLVVLKFLEVIKQSGCNPQSFTGWKNTHF